MKYVSVTALVPGDMVDLEGDIYADLGGTTIAYEFELAIVCKVVRETNDCWRVDFESTPSVGFPPDHTIALHGHDPEYAAAIGEDR